MSTGPITQAAGLSGIQFHEVWRCFSDKESGTVSLICELMEMNIYELIQGLESPTSQCRTKEITVNVWLILGFFFGFQDVERPCLTTQ